LETISKRLKSTLQKEMEIDKIYKNEEIRRLIFEKTGMRYGADYMETHFTGCLCALRKSGDIVQVQRGEYKRVDSESAARRGEQARRGEPETGQPVIDRTMTLAQVKREVLQSLRRENAYLNAVAQNITLSFDMPEGDIQYMLKLKELIRKLEEFERMMM